MTRTGCPWHQAAARTLDPAAIETMNQLHPPERCTALRAIQPDPATPRACYVCRRPLDQALTRAGITAHPGCDTDPEEK